MRPIVLYFKKCEAISVTLSDNGFLCRLVEMLIDGDGCRLMLADVDICRLMSTDFDMSTKCSTAFKRNNL